MTTPSAEGREPAEGPDAATVSAMVAGGLGLALTVGAFAMFGSRAGLSVAAGATLAVANLVAMSAIIRRVLQPSDDLPAEATAETTTAETTTDANAAPKPEDAVDHAAEGKRGGAAWGAFGLAKIVFLFGGIYVLLTRGLVDPMPLVVGYGVLPLGIAASSLFTSLSPRVTPGRRRK